MEVDGASISLSISETARTLFEHLDATVDGLRLAVAPSEYDGVENAFEMPLDEACDLHHRSEGRGPHPRDELGPGGPSHVSCTTTGREVPP